MIQFLRSFFGLNSTSSNRKVLGANVSFDLQEVAYIKDSNDRLTILLNLYKKYKGTLHADKIKAVYEKTRKIHEYLLSQKRIHELELFHIQHTEHFISTFALIVDIHERHKERSYKPVETEPEVIPVKEPIKKEPVPIVTSKKEPEVQIPVTIESSNGRGKGELFDIVEKARYKNKQADATAIAGAEAPMLHVPEISIDTIAKAFYFREAGPGKQIPNEISFISSPQEKEAFQAHICNHLGAKNIYYVGNGRISKLDSKNPHREEVVPIIYWSKFSYAITLHDYRMFPVKINRHSH
jgi:hypothetical protein